MRTFASLAFVVCSALAQRGEDRRQFGPEPSYSRETPFRDSVPAPVFGAGHRGFQRPYWGENDNYRTPWAENRPFGEFDHGGGRDTEKQDGRGSEDSGEARRPAKVVGVNMQMVAGMYPDGHFSPLSGPFEEGNRQEKPSPRNEMKPRGRQFLPPRFRGIPEDGSTYRERPQGPRRQFPSEKQDEPSHSRERAEVERRRPVDENDGFRDSNEERGDRLGGRRQHGSEELNGDKDERKMVQKDHKEERHNHSLESTRPSVQDKDEPHPHIVDGDAGMLSTETNTTTVTTTEAATLPDEPLVEATTTST